MISEVLFVQAAALADLRKGEMCAVQIGDREIVICHARDGAVFALDNICTHAYTRMSEGRFRGHRLICPLHGACFDVRDGRVIGGPAIFPLGSYATRIVDGMIEVGLNTINIKC